MKEFLTAKEYAEATGIPLRTVWRWLRQGKLAHLHRPQGVRQYRIPCTALAVVPTGEALPNKVVSIASRQHQEAPADIPPDDEPPSPAAARRCA